MEICVTTFDSTFLKGPRATSSVKEVKDYVKKLRPVGRTTALFSSWVELQTEVKIT